MSDGEKTYYRAPDGTTYRITIERDEDAESPRQWTNVSTLVTWDRQYGSPDDVSLYSLPTELLNGDGKAGRKLRKYAALSSDIIAMVPLNRDSYDGTLSTDPDDNHNNHEGIAFVTAADWKECMGDSPVEGGPWPLDEFGNPDPNSTRRTPSALEAIEQEVRVYNDWATGEFAGYVIEQRALWVRSDDSEVEMHTWEDVDDGSCWGFESAEYALEQALELLPEGSEEIDRNDSDLED